MTSTRTDVTIDTRKERNQLFSVPSEDETQEGQTLVFFENGVQLSASLYELMVKDRDPFQDHVGTPILQQGQGNLSRTFTFD